MAEASSTGGTQRTEECQNNFPWGFSIWEEAQRKTPASRGPRAYAIPRGLKHLHFDPLSMSLTR